MAKIAIYHITHPSSRDSDLVSRAAPQDAIAKVREFIAAGGYVYAGRVKVDDIVGDEQATLDLAYAATQGDWSENETTIFRPAGAVRSSRDGDIFAYRGEAFAVGSPFGFVPLGREIHDLIAERALLDATQ